MAVSFASPGAPESSAFSKAAASANSRSKCGRPAAVVTADPRMFKLFDGHGFLDTACRFHSTYAALPAAASVLDVLGAFGNRLRFAREALWHGAALDTAVWHASSWHASSWHAAAWHGAAWNAAAWHASSWHAAAWRASSWHAAAWHAAAWHGAASNAAAQHAALRPAASSLTVPSPASSTCGAQLGSASVPSVTLWAASPVCLPAAGKSLPKAAAYFKLSSASS